jgi:tRNA(Ile)-lysidine synthase
VSLVALITAALDELMPGGRRWLVAVSGGSDSVAALRLLLEAGRDVVAGHVDHRLRPTSGDDARFVAELCDGLGVRLAATTVDVSAVARERGWNLEDAARRVRYAFLHRAAGELGADGIVVAHTRDDQAETFLRQALRGTAFPAGIPPRRGLVVRPLLGASRAELREYLVGIGQAWREDETNLDVRGQERAWLRHEVLPLLETRYPRAAPALARTAAGIADARDALMALAAQRLGTRSLSAAALARERPGLQRAAVAGLLEAAGAVPSHDLVEEAVAAAARASAGERAAPWRRDVGGGKVLRLAYGRLEVVARGTAPARGDPVAVRGPADMSAVLGGEIVPPVRPEALADLAAQRGDALVLRTRRRGDRVRLSGGTRLLSDLLVDLKVPREDRDRLRVLAADGEVFWVEGLAASAALLDTAAKGDADWMRVALREAELAAAAGEVPVGAAVVRDGELLAAARNRTEADGDPSAHAEVLALRAAASAGDRRLEGATLYVTLEPCPMCFGAVLQTRVARVVYGADNLREGALGSVVDLRAGAFKRLPAVEGGLLAKESARLLRSFFAERRGGEHG